MYSKNMDKKKKVRNPIALELITSSKFKHKKERSYKERIQVQNEQELDQEIKEFVNGKTEI